MEKTVQLKEPKKKLFRYLLKFAKPYTASLFTALFFVIVSTAMELLNPFLVKIAIDEHISGDTIPMVEVSADTKGDILKAGNRYFMRQKPNGETKVIPTYTVETFNGDKYLMSEGKKIQKIDNADYKNYRNHDLNAVTKISIFYLVAIFVNFLASWIVSYTLGKSGANIIYDIRKLTFEHILTQSHTFFNNMPVGKLMTRVTSDTQTLSEFYTNVLITFIADFGLVIGIMFLMLRLDYKLALMIFILVPIIVFISIEFRNRQFKIFRAARTKLSIINTVLNEYLSGMSVIRIFGKENKMDKKFDEKNSDYLNTILHQVRNHAFFRPIIEVIRSLGEAFLIYYGGGKVIQGHIEFGTLFIFITYLKQFFRPIMEMTERYNIMQLAFASVEKIAQILETDTEIKPLTEYNGKIDPEKIGEIEFKNVHFSYVAGEEVIKGISFKVKKGESVAFVGATGAGKTSIISLLARFYDIDSGEITIDGRDIRSFSTDELRRRLGFVLQDVFLFAGDIKYNITLGEEFSNEEIIAASKRVHSHDFIKDLSEGYDTPVQERGSTLSTGQRQLLSFARTILRDPEILILDEATASIDTETEMLIQEGLKELMKDRTSIAIAHRLSTISDTDRIYVMNKGQIVETGNHEELMAMKGYYYRLYQLQLDSNE
ncbi:MAG: ABC transporter ATP-binding protein/permease [Ezakiella sp.]|nr:ABC transporter ATP-binding protein/permease [Ezakiella sp.]MDD7471636.1 ABC transporter ATP-binding protein [Bacillota bacterium]MDY3923420.1 ABC transporter ATP-binding protein [Ezakiella sp.]